ncbi:MAG: universal stress protein [Desulfobacteraceae bacterium]|jgi:nucleotide-binding universal stress UspA family protein
MIKHLNTILFATNLSEAVRPAFDLAAAIATRFQSTIVLLHVIKKIPDYAQERLRGLIGKAQWETMQKSRERNAQEALIGKRSSNTLIQEALKRFCSQAGIDDGSCGYHSRKIVVTEGDVIEEIVQASKKYKCDLIIMASREGFVIKNSIGPIIKSVMLQSIL